MPKATPVRFTDEMFARLDQASARTGMPVTSIVIAACLEWMQRHTPGEPSGHVEFPAELPRLTVPTLAAAPRWSTIRRAVEQAVAKRQPAGIYPFQRFTASGQRLLSMAQAEALKAGLSSLATNHILFPTSPNPNLDSAQILGP